MRLAHDGALELEQALLRHVAFEVELQQQIQDLHAELSVKQDEISSLRAELASALAKRPAAANDTDALHLELQDESTSLNRTYSELAAERNARTLLEEELAQSRAEHQKLLADLAALQLQSAERETETKTKITQMDNTIRIQRLLLKQTEDKLSCFRDLQHDEEAHAKDAASTFVSSLGMVISRKSPGDPCVVARILANDKCLDGSDRAKWVEAGDVIMAVDGIRTSELTPSQLLDIFTTFEPGAMVKLQVLTERQGVQGSLNVRQLYNSLPNHRHGYSVCLHVAHKPESHSREISIQTRTFSASV